MKVENAVGPNEDQIKAIMEPGHDKSVYMVNLLKFKDKAEYEDGRETDLSGREAYMLYGNEVREHLLSVGGKAIFAADVTHLTIGSVEELWDEVAIAMYPNRKAMMEMSMKPEFQASAVHRTAGLEGQLNIETQMSGDMKFGDGS